MNLCPGFTYCGIKEKHQEYISETNQVKISIKKTKDKIQNLENQLSSIKDFESQSEHQFIKNMKHRLIAMNKSYEQNKVLLMRHLRLLRTELKGKIPPVTCNDNEQLQILLKKCTEKMQQTIGDEYAELIASTSGTDFNNSNITSSSNPNCSTSVKAHSKANVNIFTGNISPVQHTKQEPGREVVTCKQIRSDATRSSSSESSSDENEMRKRKKQKKRRKREERKKNIMDRYYAENSYGVERFPFCRPLDTIPPNYYPITYGMPPMLSEYQRGVPITSLPGIPGYQAYNIVPQYGNQFGQFLQTPQQQNFAQSYGSQFGQFFDTPQQPNFAQSYVPTFSASSRDMQGQTQTSVNTISQPGSHSIDALLTAVELSNSVENKLVTSK